LGQGETHLNAVYNSSYGFKGDERFCRKENKNRSDKKTNEEIDFLDGEFLHFINLGGREPASICLSPQSSRGRDMIKKLIAS
jgi:hypothetical protein